MHKYLSIKIMSADRIVPLLLMERPNGSIVLSPEY
jgi:hypothetical protein